MTTGTTRLPLRRYFGVWPYRPVLVGIVAFVFIWGSVSYRAPVFSSGTPLLQVITTAAVSALTGLVMGLVLALAERLRGREARSLFEYVLVALLAGFVANAVRVALGQVPGGDGQSMLGITLTGTGRLALLIVLTQAIAGASSWRLQGQIDRAEQALQDSREQQAMMLEADESVRRQVAEVLHDGVQAGLVAACLELRLAASRLSEADRAPITSVIDRLEAMRAIDVRAAARVLSPSLESQDLLHCLDELGSRYAPATVVEVDVDDALQHRLLTESPDTLLACYRIAEQALLNAVAHGAATRCSVDVSEASDGMVVLSVVDNGRGPTDSVRTGLGFALITTWTRLLAGSWSLTAGAHEGAVLEARLDPTVANGPVPT